MKTCPSEACMPFWEHVEELRKCLLKASLSLCISFIACFIWHQELILFFYPKNAPQSVEKVLRLINQKEDFLPLVLNGPIEGISLIFKVCFWSALCISYPFWSLSLLSFFDPVLKKHKKKNLFIS